MKFGYGIFKHACLILLLMGCTTSKPKANSLASLSDHQIPITCVLGEAQSFSLTPVKDWSQPITIDNVKIENANIDRNVRIDYCFGNNQKVEVKRLVTLTRTRSGVRPFFFPVTETATVKGFNEAIFGELQNLHIKISSTEFNLTITLEAYPGIGPSGVLLKSWAEKDGKLALLSATVGNFEYGDFSASEFCKPFEKTKKSISTIDGVQFTFDFCTFPGQGESVGWYPYKITIYDKMLPDEFQHTVLEKESLLSVKWRHNHHNSCDALSITLPYVKYGLTGGQTFTMSAADCDPFENAPARKDTQKSFTKYRIQYADRPWIEGSVEIPHFLEIRG